MTTRVSSPSRVASPPAAISPFALMPPDDATAGAARGVRPSSQNETSTTGPIPTAKTSVPIPTVPPSRKPTTSAAISSPVRAAPILTPRPLRGDEHQRVARPGAERRADVERRADAEADERDRDQPDPDAEPLLRERVDGVDRRQDDHERADQESRSGACRARSCALSRQASRSTTTETMRFAAPNEIPSCSARPWCSTSHGGRPSSDSRKQTIPHGAEEEPGHEPGDARGEAAVEGGGASTLGT